MAADETSFQLSEQWFALGVVTPERLASMRDEFARGDDGNLEHYRWRAFATFLSDHRPLTADLALALYDLGASDPDRPMGESMMNAIVRLPECPVDVLDAAAASGLPHLAQLVAKRRESEQPS